MRQSDKQKPMQREREERKNHCESSSICIRNLCLHKLLLLVQSMEKWIQPVTPIHSFALTQFLHPMCIVGIVCRGNVLLQLRKKGHAVSTIVRFSEFWSHCNERPSIIYTLWYAINTSRWTEKAKTFMAAIADQQQHSNIHIFIGHKNSCTTIVSEAIIIFYICCFWLA